MTRLGELGLETTNLRLMNSMENIQFLIAKRRNEQERNGKAWLIRFCAATGMPSDKLHFVEPTVSIPREAQRRALVEQGLRTKAVVRQSGLHFDDVCAMWNLAVLSNPFEMLACELHNSPDFPILIESGRLFGKLEALLRYDGDTVHVATIDLSKGVSVDMYSEREQMQFELDRWGSW